MRATIITALFLILLVQNSASQNLIAVQNGGNPTFYNNLDSAIVHSQNGDTIYIPGGNFSLSVPVEKRLHIFGVGHVPDSTLASGQTRVSGNLSLINNASDGSLTGVYLLGAIITSSGAVAISNYLVQRCRFGGFSLKNTCSNWIFIQNVISGSYEIIDGAVSSCFFYNNILSGSVNTWNIGFSSSIFKNNILLTDKYWDPWSYCWFYTIKSSFSTFENNIFIATSYSCQLINNSAFTSNLFVESDPLSLCSECTGYNNIYGQPQSSIFINQSGNSFSYSHDYHLQPTSSGKNAGKDGTDIGIYGGAFPWKAGSVPINPHVQFQSVSGVDPTGNIHVVVKVAAQDH